MYRSTSGFLAVILFLCSSVALGAVSAQDGTIDPFSGKPCYKCHRSRTVGVSVHGALDGNKCTPCHKLSNGNHQANHFFSEVRDKTAALCYECHDDSSREKSVHGPIIEKNCLSCHSPHTSGHSSLLKKPLYRLCFDCHEQSLFSGEAENMTGKFRNGKVNLHFTHFSKNGIGCLSCHQPHASSLQRLIVKESGKGKERVTINYRQTENGGSCSTSCHDQLEYRR